MNAAPTALHAGYVPAQAFPYALPARLMRDHLTMLRALDRATLDARVEHLPAAADALDAFRVLFAGYRSAAVETAFPILVLNTADDPNAAVSVRMTQRQFDATSDYVDARIGRFAGRPTSEWDADSLLQGVGLARGRLAALARRLELVLLTYYGPPPRSRRPV